MWGRNEEYAPSGKVSINPSYEWTEYAKSLNVSHRELEVFALTMDGHTNEEIAHILDIQYQSVKNHISSLYKKLKAKNMAQATKLLLFGNLIKIETSYKVVDREQWIKDTKSMLVGLVDLGERERLKKFLMEHGIYGELYLERVNELKGEENGEGDEPRE